MSHICGIQKEPTGDQKDTVQSQAGEDKGGRADTNQSTINKTGGLGDTVNTTTNGSSDIPLSNRNSGEDRASSDSNVGPAAAAPSTSPPSTVNRPPVRILSPSDESNSRLREPLLEDD